MVNGVPDTCDPCRELEPSRKRNFIFSMLQVSGTCQQKQFSDSKLLCVLPGYSVEADISTLKATIFHLK